MGSGASEHRRGMKRLLDLGKLAVLSAACTLTACDAPEKSVGQESDGGGTGGETDAGSDSDTSECGPGILPCNGSDTDEPGGSESTTGAEPSECANASDATDCADMGCTWLLAETYSTADGACELIPGDSGYCVGNVEIGPSDGCGLNPHCADDLQLEGLYRELDDGSHELLRYDDCTLEVPAGFMSCATSDAPAACDCLCDGEASLPTGWETELSAGGCADMTVYGGTADGSIGVAITTGLDFEPVAAAVSAGETLTTTHDVGEFQRVSVYTGDNVLYPECNDALDPDVYEIQEEWVATAGTITIEVVPEMDPPKFSTQGYATVTVTGLEVSYAGVTESVDEFVLSDIAVGWLPG